MPTGLSGRQARRSVQQGSAHACWATRACTPSADDQSNWSQQALGCKHETHVAMGVVDDLVGVMSLRCSWVVLVVVVWLCDAMSEKDTLAPVMNLVV